MKASRMLASAGIFGATGVALGAFGAHLLKARLTGSGMLAAWETAVHYQLVHAVALLALTGLCKQLPARKLRHARWTGRLWGLGIACFSGSLYGLALGGPKFLGPVTPLGGAALIAGWVCLFMTAFAKDE